MKVIKQANGKKTLKMSKSEWLTMGKKAGWMKQAGFYGQCPECNGDLDMAYNESTGQERLQCTVCDWHQEEY